MPPEKKRLQQSLVYKRLLEVIGSDWTTRSDIATALNVTRLNPYIIQMLAQMVDAGILEQEMGLRGIGMEYFKYRRKS